MKWFPKREGMAMGIVVGGFGFGAFVFNQVSKEYLLFHYLLISLSDAD